VPSLIEEVRSLCGETTTIVAPDLGAVHLAERFAEALQVPIAVVHKTRISGEHVRVSRVTGHVAGRSPIIVDDMISTAGTIEAAYHALSDAGCQSTLTIAATHGLFGGPAVERLLSLPVRRILVSDSVARGHKSVLPLHEIGLANILADVIQRLNQERSLTGLLDRR
jgi:ribose-phosphate pyrophosphokinase